MKAFYTVWAGQVLSMLGSELTGFALGVWVFQQTGSVTKFATIIFATTLPGILLSPVAGAVVDRLNRRTAMLVSDSVSALSTLAVASLLFTSQLELWHIIVLVTATSIAETFQSVAYSASFALMVPTEKLGRANGFYQLGSAVTRVLSPLLAGVLIQFIGLKGVILVDFASFVIGVGTLLMVRMPSTTEPSDDEERSDSILRDMGEALSYLRARSGLLLVMGIFMIDNFAIGLANVAGQPLVLSFASPAVLGTVLSIASTGFIIGSIAMSAWGGPKKKINGILGFSILFGLGIMLTGIWPSAIPVCLAMMVITTSAPILFGSSEALWQAKVDLKLQGRVLSFSSMVSRSALLASYVLAGPLADKVFEPMLMEGGALADSVGRVIGVGPGRGIGFMFILFGALPMLAGVLGYLHPRLRRVDDELPDANPEAEESSPEESLEAEKDGVEVALEAVPETVPETVQETLQSEQAPVL